MEITRETGSLYALEAKVAPNRWLRVDEMYPEIDDLRAWHGSLAQAKAAKAALKRFLIRAGTVNSPAVEKRPLRIRRIAAPAP